MLKCRAMLGRRAFAAAISPSAPFLIPRSLFCPVVRYASRSSFLRKVRSQHQDDSQMSTEPVPELLQNYRSRVGSNDIRFAVQRYPRMLQDGALNHNDMLFLAKLAHRMLRNETAAERTVHLALTLRDRLIEDVRSGAIPPHHVGIMHLISTLKERREFDKGVELWSWVSNKDDNYLSPYVYGAAIELFTLQSLECGGMGVRLSDLENMYAEALTRFPGDFAAYHLQPNAILPDRRLLVEMKGLNVTLLQGIAYARLMLGDYKGAYLALDTALRLFPTQVSSRFYEMFIYNRPLAEAYRIFITACRSKAELSPDLLNFVLMKLTDSMTRATTLQKVNSVAAILNVIEAYVSIGNTLATYNISQIAKAFEALLPKVPLKKPSPEQVGKNFGGDSLSAESSTESKERWPPGPHNRYIAEVARKFIFGLHAAGVPPSVSSFSALIGLVGSARMPDLLGFTILDLEKSRIAQNEVLRRNMVLAAGKIGHQRLLETTWQGIVEARSAANEKPSQLDWQALVRASRYEDNYAFLDQQMREHIRSMPANVPAMIFFERKNQPSPRERTEADNQMLDERLPELEAQVEEIVSLVQASKLRDLYKQPLRELQVPIPSPIPEDMERAIYDEFTTDPRKPEDPNITAPLTGSGYRIDELRFVHWKTINECLMDAEYDEKRRNRLQELADNSPTSKIKYVNRLKRFIEPHLDPRNVPGRFEEEQLPDEQQEYTLESARERIRKLRNVQWSLESGYDKTVE